MGRGRLRSVFERIGGLAGPTWTVPASRRKAGKELPLSDGQPAAASGGRKQKIGVRKQLCRRAEAQRTEKGQVHIWLEERWLDKLKATRAPGESYSDAIIRLATVRGPKFTLFCSVLFYEQMTKPKQ